MLTTVSFCIAFAVAAPRDIALPGPNFDVFPAQGTEVPTNATFWLSSNLAQDRTLSLVDADGAEVASSVSVVEMAFGGRVSLLTAVEPLRPLSTVHAFVDDFGTPLEIASWTTAAGADEAAPDAPVLTAGESFDFGHVFVQRESGTIAIALAEEDPSLTSFSNATSADTIDVQGPSSDFVVHVAVVDAAGHLSGVSTVDVHITPFEDPGFGSGGCGGVVAQPLGAFLIGLRLLRLRRRSRK